MEEDSLDEQASLTSSGDSDEKQLRREEEMKDIARKTEVKVDKKGLLRQRSLFQGLMP